MFYEIEVVLKSSKERRHHSLVKPVIEDIVTYEYESSDEAAAVFDTMVATAMMWTWLSEE